MRLALLLLLASCGGAVVDATPPECALCSGDTWCEACLAGQPCVWCLPDAEGVFRVTPRP